MVSVSVPGMGGVSEGTESGRWTLVGDVLQLQSGEGTPSAQKVAWKGGLLTLGARATFRAGAERGVRGRGAAG